MNQLSRNDLKDVLLVRSWARGAGRRLTTNLADVLSARLGSADDLIAVVRVPRAEVHGFGKSEALRHAHLVVLEDAIEVWPSDPSVGDQPLVSARYADVEDVGYEGNMLAISCKGPRSIDVDCGRDTAPWITDLVQEGLGRWLLVSAVEQTGAGAAVELTDDELELSTVHLGGYGTGLLPAAGTARQG